MSYFCNFGHSTFPHDLSKGYAPVNVKPHLPQVGQRVGFSRGLSINFVPRVGAFVKVKIKAFNSYFQRSDTVFSRI